MDPKTDHDWAGAVACCGVDNRGEMAGTGIEAGNSYPDCVYFDGALLLDLTSNSGNFCHFSAMNSRGVAVGQYYDFSAYLNYAVLYTHRKLTFINKLVDSFLQFNDEGWAVGNLSGNGFAVYDVGTRSIVYELYDPRGQCAMSYPYGINDVGIVFGYDQCDNQQVRYETVSGGTFTYFEPPAGYAVSTNGSATVFNNLGQIALSKVGSGHAFLWLPSGNSPPLDLGALAEDPSGTYTVGALNDRMAAGVTSGGYAWVWTRHDGIRNLATLLPPNSYGPLEPQALDAQGDLGCASAVDPEYWFFLRLVR